MANAYVPIGWIQEKWHSLEWWMILGEPARVRVLRVTALCCIAPPEKYNFPYRYSIHIQPHLKHRFEMPTGASERLPLVPSESCPRSPLVFWLTLPYPDLTGPARRELQEKAGEETIQTFSFTSRCLWSSVHQGQTEVVDQIRICNLYADLSQLIMLA